jgi:hypothetical protein
MGLLEGVDQRFSGTRGQRDGRPLAQGMALASRIAACANTGKERQMTTKDEIGATTEIETGPIQNGRAQPEPRGFGSRALSAIGVRQGVISGRVVTVLGVSLVLALTGIVFAFVVAT